MSKQPKPTLLQLDNLSETLSKYSCGFRGLLFLAIPFLLVGCGYSGCSSNRSVRLSDIEISLQKIDSLTTKIERRGGARPLVTIAESIQSLAAKSGFSRSDGALSAAQASAELDSLAQILSQKSEGYVYAESETFRNLQSEIRLLRSQTRSEAYWPVPVSALISSFSDFLIAATIAALLLLLWFTNRGKALLDNLFKGARRMGVFGIEIELSDETRRQVDQVFDEISKARNKLFRKHKRRTKAKNHFVDLMAKVEKELGDPAPSFRATLHIPDILLDDTLYQLLDYYKGGGGAERTFTIRYGIIGKAWRREQSLTDGPMADSVENLIMEYGATREEAERYQTETRETYLAHVITNSLNTPLGILYIDSKSGFDIDGVSPTDATYHETELHSTVDDLIKECGVENALQTIIEATEDEAPRIQLHNR